MTDTTDSMSTSPFKCQYMQDQLKDWFVPLHVENHFVGMPVSSVNALHISSNSASFSPLALKSTSSFDLLLSASLFEHPAKETVLRPVKSIDNIFYTE